jgi:hypothetical protein
VVYGRKLNGVSVNSIKVATLTNRAKHIKSKVIKKACDEGVHNVWRLSGSSAFRCCYRPGHGAKLWYHTTFICGKIIKAQVIDYHQFV